MQHSVPGIIERPMALQCHILGAVVWNTIPLAWHGTPHLGTMD